MKDKKHLMVNDNGYINFYLELIKKERHYIDFKIYQIQAWGGDEFNTPDLEDCELYLQGIIKWDGCSHIYFGEGDNSGYIHMCGLSSWKLHTKLLKELWEFAEKNIDNFDKDIAE